MLPKALNRDEVLRAARAQAALRDWPLIVGKELAKRSKPDRYAKGTVWVAVQGSAWAQELRLMKERILTRLREHCGEPGLFQDLRFGVRPISAGETEIAEPAVQEIRKDTTLSIREIAAIRLAKMRGQQPDPAAEPSEEPG